MAAAAGRRRIEKESQAGYEAAGGSGSSGSVAVTVRPIGR
jgi:hypothetical protein